MMPLPPIGRGWANLIGLFGALAFGAGLLLGLIVSLVLLCRPPTPAPVPSVEMPWPSKPVLEEHRP